ncbi:hypothetical protein KIN20_001657 [Parelaphostrongylus tenuis]|uniref:Uncharacterized protein n=1 Tax=Parelaphostrongylus tenuis TaxID=148309 RepID=A0AAD5LWH6_PARTN|nr:hypothetical protein KIN20_001657 [Parelaphostrongylus tenuis]
MSSFRMHLVYLSESVVREFHMLPKIQEMFQNFVDKEIVVSLKKRYDSERNWSFRKKLGHAP